MARTVLRRTAAWLLVSMLAACAVAPRPEGDTAIFLADLARREAQVMAEPDWQFQGRIAMSADGHGGSGRVIWQQWGDNLIVQVSAPVTRRSWRLSRIGGWVRLDGLEGGPLEGDDVARWLLQNGWDVPLTPMSRWVRGLRAGAGARVDFSADGLPELIEQDGWAVQYRDWTTYAGRPVPAKLTARRGDASVRLVIDQWQAPSEVPLP